MEEVSPLRWQHRPKLRRPILVAAFEGWNDAGDAASGAARWLADRFGAEHIGSIDAEDFFDFTTTRPHIEFGEDGRRVLTWPDTEIWAAETDGPADLVVLVGHEPHLRWRTFSKAVAEVADLLDCSMVLTLGALLSDVPHTRPTTVSGTADDDDLIDDLGLVRSTYEGPTGIVGVLHTTCQQRDLPSASLWAAVPTYVSGAPSPKATLALVERTLALLGLSAPVTDLQIASAAYERQIDELVEADEDTAAYVASLEEAADEERLVHGEFGTATGESHPEGHPALGGDAPPMEDDPDALVEEVERFLRGD